jgi:hypothetical protein
MPKMNWYIVIPGANVGDAESYLAESKLRAVSAYVQDHETTGRHWVSAWSTVATRTKVQTEWQAVDVRDGNVSWAVFD